MARHLLDKSTTVNLNNASLEDLAGVPGIGRERAEALLMYREQNGPLANWGSCARSRGSRTRTWSNTCASTRS